MNREQAQVIFRDHTLSFSNKVVLGIPKTKDCFLLSEEKINPYDFSQWFPQEEKLSSISLDHWGSDLTMAQLRQVSFVASSVLKKQGIFFCLVRNSEYLLQKEEKTFWPGEVVAKEEEYFRPLRHYVELFRLFGLRLKPPLLLGTSGVKEEPPFMILNAVKEVSLDEKASHIPSPDKREKEDNEDFDEAEIQDYCEKKYGMETDYRCFNRLEEPEIIDDLLYGASQLRPRKNDKVLSIGVNDGREFDIFRAFLNKSLSFYGIDAAASAIEEACQNYPDPNYHFFHHALENLSDLALPKMDMMILLNTLQCTTVKRDRLLKDLIPLMAPSCRVLISIPNSHFSENDILRRPLSRQHPRHDRSLVYKDMRYLSRFFYRAGFSKIECFGTYDAFLLAKRN